MYVGKADEHLRGQGTSRGTRGGPGGGRGWVEVSQRSQQVLRCTDLHLLKLCFHPKSNGRPLPVLNRRETTPDLHFEETTRLQRGGHIPGDADTRRLVAVSQQTWRQLGSRGGVGLGALPALPPPAPCGFTAPLCFSCPAFQPSSLHLSRSPAAFQPVRSPFHTPIDGQVVYSFRLSGVKRL